MHMWGDQSPTATLYGEVDPSGASSIALRAARPVKAALLTMWYFAAFAAELAAFAVVSTTLHPLVTIPGYLLGAMANAVANLIGGDAFWS